ncbi:hypothetical protein GCM10011383_32420 [Hymenobacter cavernae]|uniref:STAS/SEC14 domain-containing protein n=2 Tax=Hymenobacter cavernae TaxID=2044852 RepID=A0ABQ1UI61_9BACT|nr:hypothetical protein GCM10011383_32420 [Hymenobacter cavernae]
MPKQGYVRLGWAGYPTSAPVWQQLLDQALVQLQHYQWHKLLGDQRVLPLFAAENQAWILLDRLPRATRAGLRYGAIVAPQNVLVRLETAAFLCEFNAYPITYCLFADEAAAIAWLEQQP